MAGSLDEFIQLDRTFHELTLEKGASDDVDLTRLHGRQGALRWPDLLCEYRVVLLSEAGSGKTEEIRNIARKLRQEGRPAFFVRIEHVSQNFEDAFEEGSFNEFSTWAASGDEGWLLLDSVDEARLRDPKDFERAVRKLGRLLAPVLQQAHIVITGRTTAWRAKTDLLLCQNSLPFRSSERSAIDGGSANEKFDIIRKTTGNTPNPTEPFKIVALDELHGVQIDAFLRGKNVADPKAFCEGVDRKEAWSLTTRPQDLAELVEFWRDKQRIGSRLELMHSSIQRRLTERDQDRSEVHPMAIEKLRVGARLVAAATTLTQESAIRVPDGAENTHGISIREVLTDWDDVECAALLSRPIFDEGIYGTVRFHHRSVREYLTAEWLHTLMVDEGARMRIEHLFFRSQYDIEVIVPTMRAVLPWLAILDERILARVCRVAPEVIFEGGDPSQLPLETRRTILRQACEQLAQPAHGRSLTDYSAVQRFANVDLTDEVVSLLQRYRDDDDIVWFLLRMVWQGEIVGAAAEAKKFAIVSREEFTRVAAFRALAAVGSAGDQLEVRRALLTEEGDINRRWLAELLPQLPTDEEAVAWLIDALARTPEKVQFEVDDLSGALSQIVADWPLRLLPDLVVGLHELLKLPPFIERQHCKISKRYGWLAQAAAQSVLRLVEARDPFSLDEVALRVLGKLPIIETYGEYDLSIVKVALSRHMTEWRDLNDSLFWQDVIESRAGQCDTNAERLTEFWRVAPFGHLWSFDASSFDTVCQEITCRTLFDDKLVALTLAFAIYRENGRPAAWRRRLKRLTCSEPELESTLDSLLHPNMKDFRSWRKQEARWKRRAIQQAARRQASKLEWKKHLDGNIEVLRVDLHLKLTHQLHRKLTHPKVMPLH